MILHDSLLPKYRGFIPLVSALCAGEPVLGVTAFRAVEDYDRGDILAQRSLEIEYPITAQEAIDALLPLYAEIVTEIIEYAVRGATIPSRAQVESEATYSLWRDYQDYEIDWSLSAAAIRRFCQTPLDHPISAQPPTWADGGYGSIAQRKCPM